MSKNTFYYLERKVFEDLKATWASFTDSERKSITEEVRAASTGRSILRTQGSTAVIPIKGLLAPSFSWEMYFYGGTLYTDIQNAIAEAERDESIEEIVFDVDSPGGYVSGVDVTALAIKRATKPTIARVSGQAASAAYWLASQAGRIVATSPSNEVGSIGVVVALYDDTEAWARVGVTVMELTSTEAPNKRVDIKTEEGQKLIIAELDELHHIFASRVAEARGVTEEYINENFGRGGMLIAEKAKKVGMIDEVLNPIVAVVKDEPETAEAFSDRTSVAENKKSCDSGSTEKKGTVDKRDQKKGIEEELMDEKEKENLVSAATAKERDRVQKLMEWEKHNPETKEIVSAAISSGKTVEDAMPELIAATKKQTFTVAADEGLDVGQTTESKPVGDIDGEKESQSADEPDESEKETEDGELSEEEEAKAKAIAASIVKGGVY